MDGGDARTKLERLKGHRTGLDNLASNIREALNADPNYKIKPSQWPAIRSFFDGLKSINSNASIPKCVFDENPHILQSLITVVRMPIQDEIHILEGLVQKEESGGVKQDASAANPDRLLDGKAEVNLKTAAQYLGKSLNRVQKLAREGKITTTNSTLPKMVSCDSLRAYLRPTQTQRHPA